MRIAVGSDHAGFHLKNRLRDMLRAEGHEVLDMGAHSPEASDYPDFAALVGRAVASQEVERGVLVCGTGAGIAMAANKIRGVRAAAACETTTAALTRSHNDANIICLGERIIPPEMAERIVRTFIETPFSGSERHVRRIQKIAQLEMEQ
ncbi:MAG TPA: ribose 5-phosphate isomerase B [Chthonomonadales bacterium]|nr:ribose 5-phosphate isomerase B [Chthonomonadales bacterium]